MCERCNEIDIAIERYRRLASGTTDKAALEAIEAITARLEAEKLALHPDLEK